jgi:hypothetical protein
MMSRIGAGRRIPVQVADDGVFDAGSSSSDDLSVSLPVRRDQLHGAAVMPERYVGKFINPPSERTVRQERAPQAWAQEATPAVRTSTHQKRHIHAPVRFCDPVRRAPPRPATAGRELKAPTWSH